MVDLFLFCFVMGLLALAIRRPFIAVLAYLYVDILAPQKISWHLLSSLPISLITFVAAFGGWMIADDKRGIRFTGRQALLTLLLCYVGVTTLSADFPAEAADKWSWVWKALLFAIFLPLTLRTRLRIEGALLFMVLSAGAIVIDGGIKTIFSGGGYDALRFFVSDNSGLYEGSTLSTVAIAMIPLIAWLARHGSVFGQGPLVKLFALALGSACCLIPIGTQTRTGLLCLILLSLLSLRAVKRRLLYLGMLAGLALVAVPFLPDSYTKRMSTIENHQADQSASTRVAVWMWTLGYVAEHPFGGGFDAYRSNRVTVTTTSVQSDGGLTQINETDRVDQARAYHSAYFEMLGEQGWPGLLLWLTIHVSGLVQLELAQRRLRRSADPLDQSDLALARALQNAHCIYLLGAVFIGIAYQPFVYMLIGLQIAMCSQIVRRRRAALPARPPRQTLRIVPEGAA